MSTKAMIYAKRDLHMKMCHTLQNIRLFITKIWCIKQLFCFYWAWHCNDWQSNLSKTFPSGWTSSWECFTNQNKHIQANSSINRWMLLKYKKTASRRLKKWGERGVNPAWLHHRLISLFITKVSNPWFQGIVCAINLTNN